MPDPSTTPPRASAAGRGSAADEVVADPALREWIGRLVAAVDASSASQPLALLGAGGAGDPAGSLVVAAGAVVVKLHAPRTDPAGLSGRLAAIARRDLAPLWLQPLVGGVQRGPGGRLATVWPRGRALEPEAPVPWTAAGALLAALHAVPAPADAPGSGGRDRLGRAVRTVSGLGDRFTWLAELGRRTAGALPNGPSGGWVHGDFHLGQLVQPAAGGLWLLLDPDDAGADDPAWDLARPAGFWAAGLLDDDAWSALLTSYRDAGGPAVPRTGDPWPRLELPARAAVIVATARELSRAPDGAASRLLLDACRRMARATD